MSYHRNSPGERGRLTEQYAAEPTGYHQSMGAIARSVPPLRVAMPRAGVQRTVPFVARRVIRRPARLIIPPHPRQQTAPRPARYRGTGPKRRPLRPDERLMVDMRPRVDPPPIVEQAPPNVLSPAMPPAPSSPPLDVDYGDPFDWSSEDVPDDIDYGDPLDFEASEPEVEGGELLETPPATTTAPPATTTAPAPKPFPWKTVGIVAAIGTALYLIGRK